ncbi:MAG: glycosyl transferase [Lachnospiraceae bacterium]|nr:glycosyl transferase [Lachnospiraceae bacterium]
MDIIEDLDTEDNLDGLETYIVSLISEYYTPQEFEFTKGVQRIPKKIHYCWFGGKKIPNRLKNYIDTWKRFCPDYDIIRWDESNYDITKNQYMYEAYRVGKYGFVPDYARLDIIYNHGGVYLDTDIELCKRLDDLLCDNSFFSVDFEGCVNAGSGFGSVQFNPIIGDMMKVYNNEHFIYSDGNLNLKPCHHYQNPVLKKYGFEITQRYQKIGDNVLYPCEVFAPIAIYTGNERITEKTHSIHHAEFSWISEDDRKARERFRNKIVYRINEKSGLKEVRNYE